jgi:hypothetical protein
LTLLNRATTTGRLRAGPKQRILPPINSDYANSVYDHLTALERLHDAIGSTATPETPGLH